MSDSILSTFSNQLADAVAAVAPSVVQVHGRRRPASGLVYAKDVVLTTVRALGREDGLHVRTHDGRTLEAELGGWDPATGLAVLRASDLNGAPVAVAAAPARIGHLALAVARSWSNAVTASAGIVSVIGGPLPTGRGRSIDEVIRTTAPMHEASPAAPSSTPKAVWSASPRPPRSGAWASSFRRSSPGRRRRRSSSTGG